MGMTRGARRRYAAAQLEDAVAQYVSRTEDAERRLDRFVHPAHAAHPKRFDDSEPPVEHLANERIGCRGLGHARNGPFALIQGI